MRKSIMDKIFSSLYSDRLNSVKSSDYLSSVLNDQKDLFESEKVNYM